MGRANRPKGGGGAVLRSDVATSAEDVRVLQIPKDHISEVGYIKVGRVVSDLRRTISEAADDLAGSEEFTKAAALMRAVFPGISTEELQDAHGSKEKTEELLKRHGFRFGWRHDLLYDAFPRQVVEDVLKRSFGVPVVWQADQSSARKDKPQKRHLPAKYYLGEGEILPGEESYKTKIAGQSVFVEIERKELAGELVLDATASTQIDDLTVWEARLRREGKKRTAFLRYDGSVHASDSGEIFNVSAKKVEAAGGEVQFVEKTLKDILKENNRYKKKNPKKAKKRAKENRIRAQEKLQRDRDKVREIRKAEQKESERALLRELKGKRKPKRKASGKKRSSYDLDAIEKSERERPGGMGRQYGQKRGRRGRKRLGYPGGV